MKRSTQILRSIILMMFTAVMFTSCVKKEWNSFTCLDAVPNIELSAQNSD